MSNPLVDSDSGLVAPFSAPNFDSTKDGFTGSGLFSDAFNTIDDGQNGNWGALAVDIAADGLDALGMIADPLGSLLGAGIGWLMEHIGFIKDALDLVGGNPNAVEAKSKTWNNIADALKKSSADYTQSAAALLDQHQGDAATAYQVAARNYAGTITGAAAHAESAAKAMMVAGVAVGTVRGIIRDSISQFAAQAIIKFVVAQALAFETFGASEAAFVIDEVAEGSSLAVRNAGRVVKLVNQMKQLAHDGSASGTALNNAATDLRAATKTSSAARKAADDAARDAHASKVSATSVAGKGDAAKYKDAVAASAKAKQANRDAIAAAQGRKTLAEADKTSAQQALNAATNDAERAAAQTRLNQATSNVNRTQNNLDHLASQGRDIDHDLKSLGADADAVVDGKVKALPGSEPYNTIPEAGKFGVPFTPLEIGPVDAGKGLVTDGARAPYGWNETGDDYDEAEENGGLGDGGLVESEK